jgi:hypothetical protein
MIGHRYDAVAFIAAINSAARDQRVDNNPLIS